MTILEILENPAKYASFRKRIGAEAKNTNRLLSQNNYVSHNSQNSWDNILSEYEEYLNDIIDMINSKHRSDNYHANPLVLTFEKMQQNPNQKILLNKIGYTQKETSDIEIFYIVRNFFKNEEKEIKDGNAKINNKLSKLNLIADNILKMRPSVKTEEINYFPY